MLRKMTELEQRMTDDLDWAEHAPEVQNNPEHYGKFVVVYKKRVLAVGRDHDAVASRPLPRLGSHGSSSSCSSCTVPVHGKSRTRS